ncbi:hypothetical protein GQR58_017336 [Nymphon striatum]|nr:hypothetical protein GQR58_017336 [Nymphon striatum]
MSSKFPSLSVLSNSTQSPPNLDLVCSLGAQLELTGERDTVRSLVFSGGLIRSSVGAHWGKRYGSESCVFCELGNGEVGEGEMRGRRNRKKVSQNKGEKRQRRIGRRRIEKRHDSLSLAVIGWSLRELRAMEIWSSLISHWADLALILDHWGVKKFIKYAFVDQQSKFEVLGSSPPNYSSSDITDLKDNLTKYLKTYSIIMGFKFSLLFLTFVVEAMSFIMLPPFNFVQEQYLVGNNFATDGEIAEMATPSFGPRSLFAVTVSTEPLYLGSCPTTQNLRNGHIMGGHSISIYSLKMLLNGAKQILPLEVKLNKDPMHLLSLNIGLL